MKINLANSIRKHRKNRKMTQEQLAEALGVSVGAVYKWEAGLSLPELNLIVEIADFFDESVDALLDYDMKDNRQDAIVDRFLKDGCFQKMYGRLSKDQLVSIYKELYTVIED